MKNLIKQIIKESIGKETQIEKIKNITLPSTIKGRFLNKKQAQDLQNEIEANYTDNLTQHFKKEKNDIRMHMLNYDHPIAEKNLNGINLRITTGLIRNKEITYLLYADGKIIGEFFSVDDIKRLVKYIELNLTPNKSPEKLNEDKVTPTFVKDFLTDFGILISLNFSQITRMGKDFNSTKELEEMMKVIRKPIINGQNYFDFVSNNINTIINNPKLLSALLKQVRELLIYIEPRIIKFVKDEPSISPDGNKINYKEKWLKRINEIKENYKKIITPNIINEKVTKTKVICDNCGWSWKIKDGGDDPYVCHNILKSGRMCNHDNTPKKKTKKKLNEDLQSNVIYLSFNYDGNNEDLEDYNIDEYDIEPQTLNIAKQNNLNILSDKNIKGFLFDTTNNKIVGALWTSDDNNSFSFDIAIDKQYQGLKLSHLLIKNAIDEYNAQSDYGNFNLPMKVDVINPMLANILKTKYNFRVVKRISNDRVIMAIKKNLKEEENILNEKCWKGYTQKGMKTMFGKRYPNCVKKIKEENSIYLNESNEEYSKWKRNNVTLRGIKELGKANEVYGSFGKGLYTVPLSNKSMARQYGDIYFIVNAIPKNPKVVQTLNDAEIFRYKLIDKYCKDNNVDYSLSFFEKNTSMDIEMIKLGYDGFVIKGREMVKYKPNDIKYFKTENELIEYYNNL